MPGLDVFCPANHGVPVCHFTLAKVLLRDKHAQTGYCAVPLATRPRLLPLPPLGVLVRCSTLRVALGIRYYRTEPNRILGSSVLRFPGKSVAIGSSKKSVPMKFGFG